MLYNLFYYGIHNKKLKEHKRKVMFVVVFLVETFRRSLVHT